MEGIMNSKLFKKLEDQIEVNGIIKEAANMTEDEMKKIEDTVIFENKVTTIAEDILISSEN
jgi:hypothetical protein